MSQKALIVEEVGKPVVLVERQIPSLKAGEVLVKIEAAGYISIVSSLTEISSCSKLWLTIPVNPHDQK